VLFNSGNKSSTLADTFVHNSSTHSPILLNVIPPSSLPFLLPQLKNALRSLLSGNHDHSGRVAGRHAREDGSIHHKQVIGAVDLGVEVDDRSTAVAAIISTQLGRAHPVVRATSRGGDEELFRYALAGALIFFSVARKANTHRIDVFLDSAARRRQDPSDVGNHVKRLNQVLDALNDGLLVAGVVEVRVLSHGGDETLGDGGATARHDTTAEVLAESHGIWDS
jgi:hypothetical protein